MRLTTTRDVVWCATSDVMGEGYFWNGHLGVMVQRRLVGFVDSVYVGLGLG